MSTPKPLVLIVDDNETNRYSTGFILRQSGFEVIEAATGKEGLYLALTRAPSLVILDINLPDLSGFEVCAQIKAHTATAAMPVLHLSAARIRASDRTQGLRGGADGYLTGAVDPEELVATVNSLLRARRSEELARTRAEQWQKTFDSISEGVALVAGDGLVLRANVAFLRLIGAESAEDAIGRPVADVLEKAVGIAYASLTSAGAPHAAGSLKWQSGERCLSIGWDPAPDDHGAPGMVLKIGDVTAQRLAQERLELALRTGRMGSRDWDMRTGTLHWSKESALLFGREPGTFSPTHEEMLELVHPDDRQPVKDKIAAAIERNEPYECEFRVLWPNGEVHWLRGRGVVLRDDADVPVRMIVATTDVTAAVQAAEELARAKETAERANRAKSDFLANMSHEIRTPLGIVLGTAELLLEQSESEADREEAIQAIRRNGQQLLHLIDDILDLSKVEAGHLQTEVVSVPLAGLVRDLRDTFAGRAAAKGIDFEVLEGSALPGTIHTDPVRLRQILMNVVGNAIKFTGSGRVGVTAAFEPSGASDGSGHLVFTVRDTGPGVTAEQAKRIFEPFLQAESSTTRRFGGTGLGLALSRKLARALGGDVELAASDPSGSTFVARVATGRPTGVAAVERCGTSAAVEPRSRKHREPDKTLAGLRILVVDDAKDNRIVIGRFLQLASAEVVCAVNGVEAVELASSSAFDAVLMDMQMPLMDGYTATVRLREAGFEQPIVALTAHAMVEERQRCVAAGCSDYLTKPIDRKRLIATIAGLVRPVAPTGADAGRSIGP